MDKLFSTIQQTLQQKNQNALLQNQQVSQDKINDLLNKSAEALLCGPTCQKLKVTDELKQKYINAETNVKTAPIELERTKKNYYIFTEGRPYYDNMKETQLNKKAEIIVQVLSENFNDEVSSAETMNDYLNTAIVNSSYAEELMNYYKGENDKLTLQLDNNRGDILTNDRKTFYETQELERLERWYDIRWYIYYMLVIIFLMCWVVCPSEFTWKIKLCVMPFIIFFPYYIHYIVIYIRNFMAEIGRNLPKNVYNDL